MRESEFGKPVFGQKLPTRAPRQTEAGHLSMEQIVEKAIAGLRGAIGRDATLTTFLGFDYKVEFVLQRLSGERVPVKLVYQDSSGSAEQKMPYHMLAMGQGVREAHDIQHGYIVLGGDGWTRKDALIAGRFHPFLVGTEGVRIETLEGFVARFTPEY